jgi:hypothetical protein
MNVPWKVRYLPYYGVELTSDIIPVLPDRQTAEICLCFATLERKLGEIDRARAIYAHASQFCDPRVNPMFWSEWNTFEIETGSEDTFIEMFKLQIKRSVQAQFNTEASYLAAQTRAHRRQPKWMKPRMRWLLLRSKFTVEQTGVICRCEDDGQWASSRRRQWQGRLVFSCK